MSDATNEDSVEKSKVTVGFVWSIAASGDALQRYEDAEGELQAEQQFSCTDLQDVHMGSAVETLKIFDCSACRAQLGEKMHQHAHIESSSSWWTVLETPSSAAR